VVLFRGGSLAAELLGDCLTHRDIPVSREDHVSDFGENGHFIQYLRQEKYRRKTFLLDTIWNHTVPPPQQKDYIIHYCSGPMRDYLKAKQADQKSATTARANEIAALQGSACSLQKKSSLGWWTKIWSRLFYEKSPSKKKVKILGVGIFSKRKDGDLRFIRLLGVKFSYHKQVKAPILQPPLVQDMAQAILDAYGVSANEIHKEVRVVVIGANNGMENDPYLPFIAKYHWQASLIEPNAEVFAQLQDNFKHLEGFRFYNVAIGSDEGTMVLHKIAFSSSRWATGLATADRAVLDWHIQKGYVEDCAARYGEVLPVDAKDWVITSEVPCMRLETILADRKWSGTDIVTIDTEGFDGIIIKSMIEQEIFPDIVFWEHKHLLKEQGSDLLQRLSRLGYVHFADQSNIGSVRQTVFKSCPALPGILGRNKITGETRLFR
jgi:FkbM family methyltransferase